MRASILLLTGALACMTVSCASEPEQRRPSAKRVRRPISHEPSVNTDDKAMGMEMSIGVLDERAVDRALNPHVPAMVRCFDRAGDARRYLSGQVVLRFVVEASGAVSNVDVVQNALGNYDVERCLITAGKRVKFPRPEGNRATDFEYPLGFRSTGEMRVLEWSGEEFAYRAASSRDLASCGQLGPESVEAIAYVEPEGTIGSVGFVSQGPIDPIAGSCAAEQLHKLHLVDGRPNVVLRAVFPLVVGSHAARPEAPHVSKRSKRH